MLQRSIVLCRRRQIRHEKTSYLSSGACLVAQDFGVSAETNVKAWRMSGRPNGWVNFAPQHGLPARRQRSNR
jgi:hypothetical protein